MESNEQNTLMNNIDTEAWTHEADWQLSPGRRFGGWMKEGEGDKKRHLHMHTYTYTHVHTHICVCINTLLSVFICCLCLCVFLSGYHQHRKGMRVDGVGQRGDKWDEKRLCFGWQMHNTVCRWCFVQLYTWNLYGFIKQCHPNKLIKSQNKVKYNRIE